MNIPYVSPSAPVVRAVGPLDAKVLIVGDVPSNSDIGKGGPLRDSAGDLFDKMLTEVGIPRQMCRAICAVHVVPPNGKTKDLFVTKTKAKENGIQELAGRYPIPCVLEGLQQLHAEINRHAPNIIIALGDVSLWALTGESGIGKYRGSQLRYTRNGHSIRLVPTYHPRDIFRVWEWRQIAVMDLKQRVKPYIDEDWKEPDYEFLIQPSFSDAMDYISEWEQQPKDQPTAVDIETARSTHITCVGFGWDTRRAMSIPFVTTDPATNYSYWSVEEELAIVGRLRKLLTERPLIGQNFLYDLQYFARLWGINCAANTVCDTMVAQHVCFAAMPKGLDYLSSMYAAFHTYWKDEGKEWNPGLGMEQHWRYNAKDVVITVEVHNALTALVGQLGLTGPYKFQMERVYPFVFQMMLRGVRVDKNLRSEFSLDMLDVLATIQSEIEYMIGHPINVNSPKQVAAFFYDDMDQKVIRKRGTWAPTTDDTAMETIAKREPLLASVCHGIQTYRSLGVLNSTFINAPLDEDGRLRCYYKMASVETYRFASEKNAFGNGTNLQNIPRNRDASDKLPLWEQRRNELSPSIRKLFIPDPGYVMIDVDLDRADAQVVAWEAGDEQLKQMFRDGVDIHQANADIIGCSRQDAKQGVHLTNYGGGEKVLALTLGISMDAAKRFQNTWFSEHPEILDWHERIDADLHTKRMIKNKFGFQRFYFERIDGVLKEALAWIPQSTVGLVINHAAANIYENLPWVQILLQVHDSLVMQIPKSYLHRLPEIREQMLISIPYDDPLIIPVGCKLSDKSWGDCKEVEWEQWV